MDKKEKNNEISFDFSKIKGFFKKDKENKKGTVNEKTKPEEKEVKSESEENISINLNFFKQNKWLIPVLLILIAISFSTFFRMYPVYLPITDEWAESTVYGSYKSQIANRISQEHPFLPDTRKQELINSEFKKFIEENGEQINGQVKATSEYFKSTMQYTADNGKNYTYLLAIDPYLWYGYGKNYLECGHSGCDLREDGKYYTYRRGREGSTDELNYISFLGVYTYKFLNIFGNIPFMYAFFLIPVIMIGASVIPAFFIGKKIAGNVGGFFAGMIIAINSALLSRTPAGFSDTDSANILFPLLIMWFFIEAFYAKDWKKTGIYSLLGGISFYVYSKIWHVEQIFDFILVAIAIYAGIILIRTIISKSSGLIKKLKTPLLKSALFLVVSLAFLVLSQSWSIILKLYSSIIRFALMKGVAVTTLWPNVLTTVAEYNEVPLVSIIGQMGGRVLFAFAVLGIILSAIKKNDEGKHYIMYSALIAIWFIGTLYGFTKGIRFAILMVPAFAVAFGIGIGITYEYLSKWITKGIDINAYVSKTIIIVLCCLLLIAPIKSANNIAKNEIPSYNDAWDESLTAIKSDAEDGIGYITTWWDFGHWFVANDIRVTFDGGNQGERIHWVGKSLLTDNETESIGILRMLNCGQQEAPHVLEKYLDNDTVKAIDVLNRIVVEDKEKAKNILKVEGLTDEAVKEVLTLTHCENLLPHYVITSSDMVGKSGVWAHFGSWDFRKASMYQSVKKIKNVSEGIQVLMDEFNLSEENADNTYYEIQTTDADQWIAGWPRYASGLSGCKKITNDSIQCDHIFSENQLIRFNINLTTMDAEMETSEGILHPASIVYPIEGEIYEKKYKENAIPYSIAIIPGENSFKSILMVPELASSMFTRLFFYNGYGLKHFEPFHHEADITGENIYVWKINWEINETK